MTGPDAASAPLGDWLEGLARDPEVLLHRLDPVNRRLLLVRLAQERIRAAAFLDERALAGDETGAWVPLAAALAAAPPGPGPGGIILHCGHAGSTLLARLLGELPRIWVLREPLALQTLAAEARVADTPHARLTAEEFRRTLALTQAAFGKHPAGHDAVVVKHTSFTANLALPLLAAPGAPAVLCLWIPLRDYLATMLREEGLREGVRTLAGQWIYDVASALPERAPALSGLDDACLAALNWSAAQLSFARAAAVPGARVLSLCFDDFLAAPQEQLRVVARHFGFAADEETLVAALGGPWLGRYAKDPRYRFDARSRARELAAAQQRLRAEILRGEAFARDLCGRLGLGFPRPAAAR